MDDDAGDVLEGGHCESQLPELLQDLVEVVEEHDSAGDDFPAYRFTSGS